MALQIGKRKLSARGKHGRGRGEEGGTGGRSQTDSDTKLLYCWMFRLRISEHGPRTRSNLGRSSLTHFKGPRATTVAARGRFISSAISPGGGEREGWAGAHFQGKLSYRRTSQKERKRIRISLYDLVSAGHTTSVLKKADRWDDNLIINWVEVKSSHYWGKTVCN